jgi:hypothetical protein
MIKTAQEFVELRNSNNPELYRKASADSAKEEVWIEVIEQYPDMRQWVAHNKTVPLSILSILANDTNPRVRFVVASKRKISLDIQETLANDEDESVRLAIAMNQKTHPSILKKLTEDKWQIVSEAAKKRLAR